MHDSISSLKVPRCLRSHPAAVRHQPLRRNATPRSSWPAWSACSALTCPMCTPFMLHPTIFPHLSCVDRAGADVCHASPAQHVQRHARAAGVPPPTSPHNLRCRLCFKFNNCYCGFACTRHVTRSIRRMCSTRTFPTSSPPPFLPVTRVAQAPPPHTAHARSSPFAAYIQPCLCSSPFAHNHVCNHR